MYERKEEWKERRMEGKKLGMMVRNKEGRKKQTGGNYGGKEEKRADR